MKYKYSLLTLFFLIFFLSACGVQSEPPRLIDISLPNEENVVTSSFPDSSPEPLVFIPPTRINISVERLPDYEPEAKVLIVAGSGDPRFSEENRPLLVNRNGEKITLPADVRACSVNGLACCGDFMDGRPSAIFLIKDDTYAVMRLDGKIVTGFDYRLQYECDSLYWYTYKGYLSCLKVSENDDVTASLIDIRTGEEIVSDCQIEWNSYGAIGIYDGVITVYQNGMNRLFDYKGNLLYESEKTIRVIENENIENVVYGGEAVFYLSHGELIESNLPAGINACKVGEHTVLQAQEKGKDGLLTVLDQDNQSIHTQWYDKHICYIDGGGLIVANGTKFTAITPNSELIFFDMPDHDWHYWYTAYISEDCFLTLERKDSSWTSQNRTVFTVNAPDVTVSEITLPEYEAETGVSQLSTHVLGFMKSDYPEAYAMTDEAGRFLIEFGKYESLEEKGGFVLAYIEYDDDLERDLYDIYNNEGRLLRSRTWAETRLAMPDCIIVYDNATGALSLLYFDGRLKRLD
jgi:hypothetical protein